MIDLEDAGAGSRDGGGKLEEYRSVTGIDLNETPSSPSSLENLPSPRGAFAVVRTFHGSVMPAAGSPAEKPHGGSCERCGACGVVEVLFSLMICDGCERGFHPRCAGMVDSPKNRIEEWVCGECVRSGVGSQLWRLGDSSSSATPGRKHSGVEVLDTNSRRDTTHNVSTGGSPIGGSVAHPNLLYAGNGVGFQKVPGITQTIKFGLEDVPQSHHTQASGRCLKEIDFRFPLGKLRSSDHSSNNRSYTNRSSNNTAVKLLPRNPNEIYLQVLREFISERRGMLEEGWRVEFGHAVGSCEQCAVYCAPDGKTFQSMPEVANYLGLVPAEAKIDGSAAQQKRFCSGKRRKCAKLSVSNGSSENKEVLTGVFQRELLPGFHNMEIFASALGNNVKGMEDGDKAHSATESQPFDNGLPVQFEDFFVLSIGKVDIRPSYHDVSHIWPVGYKSCWHDKITGSLFLCEVLDGGDSGPLFRVSRRSCSSQPIPTGSVILSIQKLDQSDCQNKRECDELVSFDMGCDDDDSGILKFLSDPWSPSENDVLCCLGGGLSETHDFQMSSSLQSKASSQETCGTALCDTLEFEEDIGEFSFEGHSSSSVWKMVSRKLIDAYHAIQKRTRTPKFFCKHLRNETSHSYMGVLEERGKVNFNSLGKFCSLSGSVNIPSMIQKDTGLETLPNMLAKWLDQDRFGLNEEFVQEIIEQIPGVDACSSYRYLDKRSCSTSATVGNGLLVFKTMSGMQCDEEALYGLFKGCNSASMPMVEDPSADDRFPPPGKPLGVKLPQELVGDFLQVWELLCRFNEVLGLKGSLEKEELEKELICPWLDGLNLREKLERETQETVDRNLHGTDGMSAHIPISSNEGGAGDSRENLHIFINMETGAMKEAAQTRLASAPYCRCNGVALTKVHNVLLEVLIGELQSKVAAVVDPHFDVGELKERRGRKKDTDSLVSAEKTGLNLPPINEFTWPESARRYILAVLAMDGILDSSEIMARESGKVFRCLQGDGGVLCGSLTGVAGMEADALLLAGAIKRIFGHLNRRNDVVTLEEIESDVSGACERTLINEGNIPEWAQSLEPVRKLPTNVGARIRKCVNEALDKDPPEWAREILERSVSKEVYKGNASGPTKKAVISVLEDVYGEGLQRKTDKQRKTKSIVAISDIVMKKCRIVLRCAAAADNSKVFCNLLGRKLMNSNDNDDEGLIGYPSMVSRPLDFRTIDLRLAVGAYGGSHEAFLEDVRELWSNVHSAFGDQPHYVALAETLSKNFESLYKAEVVTLVRKLVEYSKLECSSAEVKKEINDLLVSTREIPKAPWEEGVCKVCGFDKDDDNVLLCDTCDAEYHTYCLNPPLVRIPKGNWYCPPCVAGIQVVQDSSEHVQVIGQRRRKKCQGDVTRVYLDELTNIVSKLEEKEYWEFSVNERTFLLKFLCDELLTSGLVHRHLESCAEMSAELHQKFRSISTELKNLKFREEFLVARAAKLDCSLRNAREVTTVERLENSRCMGNNVDIFSDDPLQSHGGQGGIDGSDLGKNLSVSYSDKSSFCGNHVLRPIDAEVQFKNGHAFVDDNHVSCIPSDLASHGIDRPCKVNQLALSDLPKQEMNGLGKESNFNRCMQEAAGRDVSVVPVSDAEAMCLPLEMRYPPSGTKGHSLVEHAILTVGTESEAYNLELEAVKNEISLLQDSITNVESQLLELSVRREFLGTDSAGRLYWILVKPGRHPWVIVGASVDASCNCIPWIAYETDTEIKELIEWLKNDDPKERHVKEAIMQWQKLSIRDCLPSVYHDHNGPSGSASAGGSISTSCLVTTAAAVLEKKKGPFLEYETADILKKRMKKTKTIHGRMYRCECLEPVWPSRPHCLSCHRTFCNDVELEGHDDGKCNPHLIASEKSKENIDPFRGKGNLKSEATQDEHLGVLNIAEASRSEYAELSSRLIKYQNEGLVCPFNLEDICSKFVTRNSNKELVQEVGLLGSNGVPSFVPGMSPYLSDSTIMSINALKKDIGFPVNESNSAGKLIFSEGIQGIVNACHGNASDVRETLNADRSVLGCLDLNERKTSLNDHASETDGGRCCVVPESSLRPLVGKVTQILRRLKMNLLDMDAALPEAALRPSKAHVERRWAWRAFVKSAETIFEMVQAAITLEDMIEAKYLRKGWWHWSSLSAAAKTSTMSSLALRIYSLDAAIIYEVSSTLVRDQSIPSGKRHLAQHGVDTVEKSKQGGRLSKRRKESEG